MRRHLFNSFFIFIAVIICNVKLTGQDSTEFTIGALTHSFSDTALINSFYRAGFNTIVYRAADTTWDRLANLNLLANNAEHENDWIQFYATSYYSKWEAEQNQTDTLRVGVKHRYGQQASWNGTQCWSSIGLSSAKDSLVYGPHYRQDKIYKRWNYLTRENLDYNVRFHMALHNPEEVDPEEDVCIIKVVYRYADVYQGDYTLHDSVFLQRTLKVSDFALNGDFKYINFGPDVTYTYKSKFTSDNDELKTELPLSSDTTYTDINDNNGIQFQIKWLRSNTLCTLYIDFVEVYDNYGWNQLIADTSEVVNKIQSYANSFSDWDNLKYWMSHDEPSTLDAFTPMHIVDSLVRCTTNVPLINQFNPPWFILLNGEVFIKQYYEAVNPVKLMINPIPFSPVVPFPYFEKYQNISYQFQLADSLQPGFWFVPQAFGHGGVSENDWCIWRRPDSTELKATVMLALAHGVKGLIFYKFDSSEPKLDTTCNGYYGEKGIINADFTPSDLYYVIKDNIIPRLKGNMGKALLSSRYTGSRSVYINDGLNPTDATNNNYMSFIRYSPPGSNLYYFHAGLFEDSVERDNNYFLALNALTSEKNVIIRLTSPEPEFKNIRFRNIEGGIDTTFYQSFDYDITFPAGEGYLFQVSPVVKYGGKLIYSETISATNSLLDNLVIYSGDTLKVTGTYNIKDTLIVNSGGYLVVSSGGKINVCEGGKIINNGNIITENAEIKSYDGISLRNNGNLNASYTLFSALTNNWDGIYFSGGSSGTINYCTVEKSSGALLTLNNSSPEIKNSSLHDCVNGIDILNGSSAFIYRDTIYNFTVNGIYIDNSAPFLALNVVTGDQNHDPSVPVKCENYATPYFSNLEECNGRNTLQNGTTGVSANSYSSVYMGTEAEYYHLNRIINNSYYASADSNSVIYAQLNWWGTSDPNKDLFLAGYESFIYFDPYLTEDPLEGFLMGGENNYSFLDQQLIEAKRLTVDSNYTGASNIYRSMIINNPDSAQSEIALIELKEILRKTDNNTHLNFIAQLTDSTGNHPLRKRALQSLSGIFLRKKNYPSAQAINNYLIHNYGNTEYEKSGRRNKFYTHFAKNEFASAKEELDIIKSKYETDDQITAMDWLLYLEGYNPFLLNKTNKTIAAAKTVINKFSSQNYPNPFNPSTTIRFYIEQRGKVNLTIYDILGRRISTLVDEIKDPGEYEVKFDGSRYASGVYIYRIQSNEQVLTKKFILMK